MSIEQDEAEMVNQIETIRSETSHTGTSTSGGSRILSNLGLPAVIFLVMIVVLVVILIFIALNGAKSSGSQVNAEGYKSLQAEVEVRRQELNRQRLALNLPPIPGVSEPANDIAERLATDAQALVKLVESYERRLIEKDTQLSVRDSEVLRLENLRKDISMESSRMATELQRALVNGDASESLRASLDAMQADNDQLNTALARASQEIADLDGAVSAEVHLQLQRRLSEAERARDYYQTRVREMEAQSGKSSLFAESANELLPAAVKLFGTLRGLEGIDDANLGLEYNKIGSALSANVLHKLEFTTGSSDLSKDDTDRLDHIIGDDVPDGDLILIVGYASTIGDKADNRVLSSERAKAAVNYLAENKRPGQIVQGVYLGQTNRFNTDISEANQICEVWRIRAN